MNPYDIVTDFESVVAEYTGAPYAIAIDSATNGIFLCCKYWMYENQIIECPAHTYPSVPMSILHAGGIVKFVDYKWQGIYQLSPLGIYDAAKRFTSNMFPMASNDRALCLSFHFKKRLALGKGGMILTNNELATKWFKKARYEGREGKPLLEEKIDMLGWNMYLQPSVAAYGLLLMTNMPKNNPDLIEIPNYPDCRKHPIFQQMAREGCVIL